MDPTQVLNAIGAGDKITAGMFFRLTFGRTRRLGLPIELFSFQHDVEVAFDDLDAPDGWAQPVSDLAVSPGQEAAVFDVLVRSQAVGVTAADLANYLDDLRFGISLTSMTPIDVNAVQTGAADRSTLQGQLDAAEKTKDPLAVFGDYAKYLKWILILLVVLAILYYGGKALKVAKAVV